MVVVADKDTVSGEIRRWSVTNGKCIGCGADFYKKKLTLRHLMANRSSTTYHEDQPILVKTIYINIRPLDG